MTLPSRFDPRLAGGLFLSVLRILDLRHPDSDLMQGVVVSTFVKRLITAAMAAALELDVVEPNQLLASIYNIAYNARDNPQLLSVVNAITFSFRDGVLPFHQPDANVGYRCRTILSDDNLTSPSAVNTVLHLSQDGTRYIQSLGTSHHERLIAIGRLIKFAKRVTINLPITGLHPTYQPLVSMLLDWVPRSSRVSLKAAGKLQPQPASLVIADWSCLASALARLHVVELQIGRRCPPDQLLTALLQPSLLRLTLSDLYGHHRAFDSIAAANRILKFITRPLHLLQVDYPQYSTNGYNVSLRIPVTCVDEQTTIRLKMVGLEQKPAGTNIIYDYLCNETTPLLPLPYRFLRNRGFRHSQWPLLAKSRVVDLVSTTMLPSDYALPTTALDNLRALRWEKYMTRFTSAQLLREFNTMQDGWSHLFPNACILLLHLKVKNPYDHDDLRHISPILFPNPNTPIALSHYGDISYLLLGLTHHVNPQDFFSLLPVLLACEQIGLKLSSSVLERIFQAGLVQLFSTPWQGAATLSSFEHMNPSSPPPLMMMMMMMMMIMMMIQCSIAGIGTHLMIVMMMMMMIAAPSLEVEKDIA
jgi:hypothetical protein